MRYFSDFVVTRELLIAVTVFLCFTLGLGGLWLTPIPNVVKDCVLRATAYVFIYLTFLAIIGTSVSSLSLDVEQLLDTGMQLFHLHSCAS